MKWNYKKRRKQYKSRKSPKFRLMNETKNALKLLVISVRSVIKFLDRYFLLILILFSFMFQEIL